MSSYTITTTVKIEVSGTTAHVSEPMVRAGEKVTPAGGEISGVGLELLVKLPAVGGAQVTSQSSLTAATEVDGSVRQNMPVHGVEAHADKVESPVAATSPDAESITTAGSVDAVAIESAGVAADGVEGTDDSVTTDGVAADVVVPLQASRVKQSAVGARGRRGRSAAGAKATPTVRKASPKRATSVDAGRAYRRAPEDLESIFQQAGSASAVADYYDVPRHTAQGWIRTLRRRQAKATK
ncbi:hypothetical protein [Salinispora arenicola]|uniref:hypothetical protein n=1 Tax=Salinispora arenicola TaxID=168697 RepID=UPI00048D3C66|nr:hypothetical protein [Salinispora arenicola]NIL55854.1 hypothetical protein [Salinispora arenicola]NIL60542.1 hypothetical protein [Salinispora arenicola]